MPVEYAYIGTAESAEGNADIVEAKGPDGFAARLFLDQRSHRPLMLTYEAYDPRMFVIPSGRHGSSPAGVATEPSLQPVKQTLFFDDYRAENGVMLPHRVTRAVDGETDEEWTFKTITLNPAFKPDAFSDK
jgi:hypothetical protein